MEQTVVIFTSSKQTSSFVSENTHLLTRALAQAKSDFSGSLEAGTLYYCKKREHF